MKKIKSHESTTESAEERAEGKGHAHGGKGHKGHAYASAGHSKKGTSGDTGGAETTATTGGPVFHAGMVAYPDGHGCCDEHAHHTHHEASKAYGMTQGSSPKGYGSDDEGGSSHGGEGMADNAEYC